MRAKHHLIALVCSLLTAWNAARAAEHIVVNELMASNAGMVMSPAINFDSWIELYNPTGQAVNLAGMYLSDDAGNLTRWKMPSNMGTIPAKGFFVRHAKGVVIQHISIATDKPDARPDIITIDADD